MTKIELIGNKIHGKPIEDIPNGQWFFGNPKYPCDKLPFYSASIGDSLYVKGVNGIYSLLGNVWWQMEEKGYVIESYVPIERIKIEVEDGKR